MTRKTAGTVRMRAGMSCLQNWRFVRAGEAAEQAAAAGREHPGVPEDRAQFNFTDAESRIMPAPGGGGQRPPGHRGGPCYQPALGQGSGREHD